MQNFVGFVQIGRKNYTFPKLQEFLGHVGKSFQ